MLLRLESNTELLGVILRKNNHSQMTINKNIIHNSITENINSRIKKIKEAILEQRESLKTASESTAGDKHNTSRAMMHIEEEKLNRQLAKLFQLKQVMNQFNPKNRLSIIALGSLVETNNGWIYFAIPFGKLITKEFEIMVVSLASPIGQILFNKKVGDSVQLNGKKWEIRQVV